MGGGARGGDRPGSERNVKITVPADIVMAEALYADFIGRGT